MAVLGDLHTEDVGVWLLSKLGDLKPHHVNNELVRALLPGGVLSVEGVPRPVRPLHPSTAVRPANRASDRETRRIGDRADIEPELVAIPGPEASEGLFVRNVEEFERLRRRQLELNLSRLDAADVMNGEDDAAIGLVQDDVWSL